MTESELLARSKALLAGLLVMLALATPALAFEGELDFRISRMDAAAIEALAPGYAPGKESTLFDVPVDRIASAPNVLTRQTQIHIKGTRLRVDTDTGAEGTYMLMDTDSQIAWLVMPQAKSYVEITKADRAAIADRMARMRAMVHQRLDGAGLTPEQRANVESMMAPYLGKQSEPSSEIAVTPLDRRGEVAGLEATAFRAADGGVVAVGWVSTSRPELAAVFASMQAAQHDLRPSRATDSERIDAALVKRGLPVRVQKVENGSRGPVYQVTELEAIRETPVASEYLETPAGYTKRTAQEAMTPYAHGALGGRGDAAPPPSSSPDGDGGAPEWTGSSSQPS
jgi:hypothetical protein